MAERSSAPTPLLAQHWKDRVAALGLPLKPRSKTPETPTSQASFQLPAAVLPGPESGPSDHTSLGTHDDEQMQLGLTMKTLQRLGMFHGSLISITNSHQLNSSAALAHVFSLDRPVSHRDIPTDLCDKGSPSVSGQPWWGWLCGQVCLQPPDGISAASQQQPQQTVSISQPGGRALSIQAATSISIALVRRPAAIASAPPAAPEAPADSTPAPHSAPENAGDLRPGKAGEASASGDLESPGIVAALQHYFQACPRLVSAGHLFTVADPSSDPEQELLRALCTPADPLSQQEEGTSEGSLRQANGRQPLRGRHRSALPALLWFKVTSVEPQQTSPLAVNPSTTAVAMQGTCASALPVGAEHFMRTKLGNTDCGSSRTERKITRAGDGQVLGESLAAAWQSSPCLPGLASLLPAWREVAALLAPLVHHGSRGRGLRAALLLVGPAGSGRTTAATAAAAALGLHLIPFNCHDLTSAAGPQAQSKAVNLALRTAGETAADFSPALLLLRNFEALASSASGDPTDPGEASLLQLIEELENLIASRAAQTLDTPQSQQAHEQASPAWSEQPVVLLVACVASAADLPPLLRRIFTHEVEVEAPSLDQRLQLLSGILAQSAAEPHPSWLQDAAAQTAGLLPQDLKAAAADALAMAAMRGTPTLRDGKLELLDGDRSLDLTGSIPLSKLHVTADHMEKALLGVRRRTATALGAPSVPKVKWEDVGGLEDVKRGVLDTVELPLRHPNLFAAGLKRRSGVLLYGPPGTGKTLIAKAVATECSINFLSVKGPELINMYIGESERQVREVFARARRARPCVLFFDELDSLAPARGAGSDSGGVMDRVVSQLLAEIDGVQTGGAQDLFVIGATNRPDLLDAALLRPGRLDRLLYVGVAEDWESKHHVLCALTRSFKLAADVDLQTIARGCQLTFTGADMYALCSDAWMAGLKRTIRVHEALVGAGSADSTSQPEHVEVAQEDFWEALHSLQPSLSEQELQRYAALRDRFGQSGAG
ncbi:hypothetical protein WJX84_005323 [Apatococcus fuscideae]|uniref:Peroxisomal ATPase PEX6 n=1 Tax=Apatococcus fuscideae TaxID=2026836 RepID=A0AAW1T8S4_9CHLO